MSAAKPGKQRVASGVSQLDRLLGGLFIGDNVVWHDDAGSLASVFCLNFIQASQSQNKPIIYVTFDRSPRNLLERLGPLADYPGLTILDCFTWGKGSGSDVFLRFYKDVEAEWPCRIVRVEEPRQVDQVMDALYGIHASMAGDVRFVFESLTGMQDLWGGEDHVLNFYTHSCPRLYELNTIAYWILEKNAHSSRLRAHINQIAQVSIELSIKRGTTSLTILKAERRSLDNLHKPFNYWTKDLTIVFEDEKRSSGKIELGLRLKEVRSKRGLSQTELAKLVGVTPSTISQVESNLIYPSLPALVKMAEVLSVEVSSFFQAKTEMGKRLVFPATEASVVKLSDMPEETIIAKLLTPVDFDAKAEPYLIEIAPEAKLPSHFFIHKGEEIGYVLSGKLQMTVEKAVHKLRSGDVVYLASEMPTQWSNPGPGTAKLLWIKIR
ncbi:helix-turn-helix domain-containing protein [Desulfomonile tiedjei]|uniref:Putative transcriptional regulator n=1 Tax=Desulfomonile tiedjei (strain ATCC 49306 / DSM 6799 / DCB-1) TaxID=706587 RepID=I4CBA0_DESTA|nr:helix-turn-helix domain-containing protein [Desulfomonile tiedjei]AFM26841.1 putative transcriptional regulator [Desulfomonile tiedjei DSM 6799]